MGKLRQREDQQHSKSDTWQVSKQLGQTLGVQFPVLSPTVFSELGRIH